MVSDVVAPDQLEARAQTVAREIASKPPHAVRLSKRLMKSAQSLELEELLNLGAAFQAVCHEMPDHHEAISAFIERRTPKFHSE